MKTVKNNMGANIELTTEQFTLLSQINKGELIKLRDDKENCMFLIESGLCTWIIHSDRLAPIHGNIKTGTYFEGLFISHVYQNYTTRDRIFEDIKQARAVEELIKYIQTMKYGHTKEVIQWIENNR